MKKVTYGMGLLASAMFAVAIANAQSGGGAGGAGGAGAGGSASAGAAGTGTAGGTTGTGPAGSSGVGASSPSNLNTGGAGATGTGAGAAGTRATGAGAGTGAASSGFSTQGTGLGGAAATPGAAGTTRARASAGAAGAQNAQPGGTGLGGTGTGLGTGAAGTGLGRDAAGTTGTTGAEGGFGTTGAAGVRSGTTFDTQRNLGVQGDFNQRTAAEQQMLIEQQRAAGLRTQQGDFNRARSEFSDEATLQQRGALTDQDTIGRAGTLQTDATIDSNALASGAPGELGVFISDSADRGVVVSRVVEGSAADAAGLRAGDVILGVGDDIITAPSELTRMIRAIPAGEVATLQVIRDGQEYDVDATLMPIRDRSVAVGYRGTTTTAAGGDLSMRVSRLEEQLDMVIGELREMRREVVMLRDPGAAGAEVRYGERETGTTLNGEFGTRTRTETGAEFQQREMERGIGVGTEFDQRSRTEAGIGADATERETGAGFDARTDTDPGAGRAGARVPPPESGQSARGAADEGSSQSRGVNDDLFGPSDAGAGQSNAAQSDAGQSATEDEQDQQSASDTDSGLPF